ncbi:hypothetical protein BT93_B1112 [Corymbia citriodora subsp. variegata]|nr:hypothetical protein BT93_B1112 [Corymbia citriodora subsp. variegata]
MATPSSKSCQNLNTPTRHNHAGSRSSEVGNPMKRSFSGSPFSKPAIVPNSRGFNPVTPANSPSEYPRRLSAGRESLTSFREHEDKENGKDQGVKQARTKPVAPFKSPRNFMSPTISAASKVNASPKKRVLTDRNEPVRTSVAALSDLRSSCGSLSLSEALEEPDSKLEVETEKAAVADSSNLTVTGLDRADANREVSPSSKGSRKKVAFDSNVQTIPLDYSETSDCVDVNEDLKTIPALKSPHDLLAPLDADPLMPPYDPRTNYLSPRPQFLHYKPSPRRMHYLSNEKDGNPLDDTLCIGDFSDTDLTEETLSNDSPKESDVVSSIEMAKEADSDETEDVSAASEMATEADSDDGVVLVDDSPKESDVVSSIEMAKAADSDETEDVSAASEMATEADSDDGVVLVDEEFETIPNAAASLEMVKEAVEVKKVSKRRFFTTTKCISLVFVLLAIAGMAMTGANSPLRNCSYIKGSRFSELFETSNLAESVRVDLDELAQNFWYFYGDSVSYISELIDHLKGGKRVSGFSYYNLTDLQEDVWIEKNIGDGSIIEALPIVEQHDGEVAAAVLKMVSDEADETNILELEEGDDFQIDDGLMIEEALAVEQNDAEVVAGQEEVAEDGEETHNLELGDFELRSEVTELEFPEGEQFQEIVVVATSMTGNEEQQKPDSVQVVAFEPAEFRGEKYVSHCDETDSNQKTVIGSENIEAVDVSVNSQSSEAENSTIVESESNASLFVMAGLALVGLSLAAAAAFFYVRKGSRSVSVPTPVEQPWAAKNFNISPVSASVEHTMWQRWSSPNCPTEVDMAGESCPSEMSSFQKKSSVGSGLKDASEAQSQERRIKKNYRRESLASSSSELSMGSHSYGSFTTYEKVACKHRNGDEEVVITPIRRSSRLQKQVTSP